MAEEKANQFTARQFWLQSILFVITMLTVAVAAEHRITTAEFVAATTTENLAKLHAALIVTAKTVDDLRVQTAQLATIVGEIQHRHEIADNNRNGSGPRAGDRRNQPEPSK